MQPELSVADFFAFGKDAAAHTASLPLRDAVPREPVEAEWTEVEDAD